MLNNAHSYTGKWRYNLNVLETRKLQFQTIANIFRHDRNRHGGGILIYVKDTYITSVLVRSAGLTWGDVEGVLPWWRSEGVCGGAFEFRKESTGALWWHWCRNTENRGSTCFHMKGTEVPNLRLDTVLLWTNNDLCVNMLLVIPMHFCTSSDVSFVSLFVYFLVHHSYISFDFSFFVCTIKLYKTTGSIVLDNI